MEGSMRLLLTFVLLAALVAPVYAASDNAAGEAGTQKQKTEKAPKGGFRGPISRGSYRLDCLKGSRAKRYVYLQGCHR